MSLAAAAAALALAVALLVLGTRPASAAETGFLDRTVEIDGVLHRYQVRVPRDYDPARAWPVVLFLHGSGERGDDGVLPTEIGLGTALRRYPDRWPALVVFPQAPAETRWPGASARIALAALAATEREFHTDPDRIYLTGNSMGGNGAWYLAYREPERWAAVAVVCGWAAPDPAHPTAEPVVPEADGPTEDRLAERLARVPVWIAHGSADTVVPVAASRRMSVALDRVGAQAFYLEFRGGNHNAWDPTYQSEEFPGWLFAQRRSRPARLDHIVVAVPELAAAVEAFERQTGVRPQDGGTHPFGTHNALVALGGRTYLELIAVRPGADVPEPFASFARLPGPSVVGWAVAATDLDAARTRLAAAGLALSESREGRRTTPAGDELRWRAASVGEALGEQPFVIEWAAGTPHPATTAPRGCRIVDWKVAGPRAAEVSALVEALGVEASRDLRRTGVVPISLAAAPATQLELELECPRGRVRFGTVPAGGEGRR